MLLPLPVEPVLLADDDPPPGAHGFGSGCVFSALDVVVVDAVDAPAVVVAAVEVEEFEERLPKGLAAPNPSCAAFIIGSCTSV